MMMEMKGPKLGRSPVVLRIPSLSVLVWCGGQGSPNLFLFPSRKCLVQMWWSHQHLIRPSMRAGVLAWKAVFCSAAPGGLAFNMEVAPFDLICNNSPWFPSIYDISCQTMEKWIFFSFEGLALEITKKWYESGENQTRKPSQLLVNSRANFSILSICILAYPYQAILPPQIILPNTKATQPKYFIEKQFSIKS